MQSETVLLLRTSRTAYNVVRISYDRTRVKNAGFRRLVGTGTTYSMKYCEMQLTAWESTIIDRQFSRLSFSNSSQIVYFFHSNLLICQKCRILEFFLSLFFVWILKRRAEKELKKWNIREWFSSFHHLFSLLPLFFPKSGVFDNPVFLTRVARPSCPLGLRNREKNLCVSVSFLSTPVPPQQQHRSSSITS